MRKNARTVKSMMDEAAAVKKKIDSGKLKGKALQSAKYRHANLLYRARKRQKVQAAIPKGQGYLPSFLKQMDTVRIEELVAQKIFEQFQKEGFVVVQRRKKAA